jgi:hypothetical protein
LPFVGDIIHLWRRPFSLFLWRKEGREEIRRQKRFFRPIWDRRHRCLLRERYCLSTFQLLWGSGIRILENIYQHWLYMWSSIAFRSMWK